MLSSWLKNEENLPPVLHRVGGSFCLSFARSEGVRALFLGSKKKKDLRRNGERHQSNRIGAVGVTRENHTKRDFHSYYLLPIGKKKPQLIRNQCLIALFGSSGTSRTNASATRQDQIVLACLTDNCSIITLFFHHDY